MRSAYIIDAVRTPIGSYGGALRSVRADDLAAIPIKELLVRNPAVLAAGVEDVILGCANQAGEDNRNVARMALLLAGLPASVPGETVNRLCASGLSATLHAAHRLQLGEGACYITGGIEQMTRAPYVMAKPESAFDRGPSIYDTTLGWRFVNPKLERAWGTDSMGETAENVAQEHNVSRADQDAFAYWSQQKTKAAVAAGRFRKEIVPVIIPQRKGEPIVVADDEFPRPDTTLERLAALKPAFKKEGGTVTAGNSSGLNDGACGILLASEEAVTRLGKDPLARIVSSAVVGVEPRIMGMGPVPATRLALERAGLTLQDLSVIEINEAFAAQCLACLRQLGLADNDARVNPNGGAISLGHPLGMSGARLLATAALELRERQARYALVTMCVGVGQGMAAVLERV